MKLLYIANARIPTEKAHGIQIMKMAEAFVGAGAEVEVLLPWRGNRPFRAHANPFAYYGLRCTFPIRKTFSIDLTPLRIFGHLAFTWQMWSYALAVAFTIGLRRADWYYFRDLVAAYLTLKLWPRLGQQMVVEIHTVSERRRWFYQILGERAAMIVAISQGVRAALIEHGVDQRKITVGPDGVDQAVFGQSLSLVEARTRLGLDASQYLALYAGNLFTWKGVYTLAEAARYLGSDSRVVFVGGSPKEVKALQAFVIKRHIGNADVLGYHPPTEVPVYLAAADVLVLPTSAREKIGAVYTSPIKLFEYLAAGRPIVASDVPSHREILDDKTTIFVRPDDPRALAAGIVRALHDQTFSATISNNARNLVSKYTWSRRAELILAKMKSS